jgi:uncharacterized protein YjbJ (UPF0337 family)
MTAIDLPAGYTPGCPSDTPAGTCKGVRSMSAVDKAKNKVEETAGAAKEKVGQATGDQSMEAEGKGDRAKGNLKDAGEKVKDAFKR